MTALAALLIGVAASAVTAHRASPAGGDSDRANVAYLADYRPATNKAPSGIALDLRGKVAFSRNPTHKGTASATVPGGTAKAGIIIPRTSYAPAADDWTYEAFIASTGIPGATCHFVAQGGSSSAECMVGGYDQPNNRMAVWINGAASGCFFSFATGGMTAAQFFDGKFHHVVIQRSSGLIEIFIDGARGGGRHNIGTTALTYATSVPGINLVGSLNGFVLGTTSMAATFDQVRWTQLVARYSTDGFDPPSAPFATGGGDPNWSNVIALTDFEETGVRFGMWTEGAAAWGTDIVVGHSTSDASNPMVTTAGFNTVSTSVYRYQVPSGSGMDLGSGDFTIELFGLLLGNKANNTVIVAQWGGVTNECCWKIGTDGTNLRFYWTTDGITAQTAIITNASTTVDVAVVRSGGSILCYVNGTLATTTAISGAVWFNAAVPFGTHRALTSALATVASGSSTNTLRAARVTKGVARYTGASYTLPTLPLGQPLSGDGTSPGAAGSVYIKTTRQRLYAVVGPDVPATAIRTNTQRLYAVVEP